MKHHIRWFVFQASLSFFFASWYFGVFGKEKEVILGIGLIIFLASLIPWNRLIFKERAPNHEYAQQGVTNSPIPVRYGPSILSNLGNEMGPHKYLLGGIALAVMAGYCCFKWLHADEPTLWYVGFLVFTITSIACFMVVGAVLKGTLFYIGKHHPADATCAIALLIASVFMVYARQEDIPLSASIGFILSLLVAIVAFLTARGFIVPIFHEIGNAYMGKYTYLLAACLWLSSMGMVCGLILGIKKFEILDDYESGRAILELMSLGGFTGIIAVAAAVLVAAAWLDYRKMSRLSP